MPTEVREIRRMGFFTDGFGISGSDTYICRPPRPENGLARRSKQMRIGLKIVVTAVLLLAVGCGGDKGGGEGKPSCDGWMLIRWNGGEELSGTVYLQLGEDNRFSLYQNLRTAGFATFTGSYSLSGDGTVLSGVYTGGTPWESSYAIEKYTPEELRLRSLNDGIVSVYAPVVIPAYVKDNFTDKDSRAALGRPFL